MKTIFNIGKSEFSGIAKDENGKDISLLPMKSISLPEKKADYMLSAYPREISIVGKQNSSKQLRKANNELNKANKELKDKDKEIELLRKQLEEAKGPEKKLNLSQLSNDKLIEMANEKGVELPVTEDKKEFRIQLMKSLKDGDK
jgi:hypothetical protein